MEGELGIPIKVTRISDGNLWIRGAPDLVIEDGDEGCSIHMSCSSGDDCTSFIEKLTVENYCGNDYFERFVDPAKLHILNPWFPKTQDSDEAFYFHKKIMKTFVLFFFFSVKLIILARRAKERVNAPGGLGFIAAQEDFDHATMSQRIQ